MNKPNHKPKQSIPTFRATVTPSMIAKIISLARCESPLSSESIELLTRFTVLQTKVDNLAITPAYTTTEKFSTIQSLGGIDKTAIPNSYILDGNSFFSKESYWKACYDKYAMTPADCDVATILSAKEHMYLNDLMTEDEIAEFESASI